MLSSTVLLVLIGFCVGGHSQDGTLHQRGTSSRCPLGFIGYRSSCYLFSHETATYAEAVSFCRYFDGSLAQINSRGEEDFIRGYLKRKGGGVNHFISGTDIRIEGIWTWEKPLRRINYRNWYQGEPNNSKGRENCLELHAYFGYRMNDYSCGNKIRFVCEKKL